MRTATKALHERIGATDRMHLHLPRGHLGAVVSRKASKGLWPQLAGFWGARDHLGRLDDVEAPQDEQAPGLHGRREANDSLGAPA